MQNWVKIPMLIFLQRVVDGVGVDNLIVVIMEASPKARGLSSKYVTQKLLCFGVDGVRYSKEPKLGSSNIFILIMHHFGLVFIAWFIDAIWLSKPCLPLE